MGSLAQHLVILRKMKESVMPHGREENMAEFWNLKPEKSYIVLRDILERQLRKMNFIYGM